uniref:Uncharacterized protein n=1 Tax=Lotus japonicus TaxID=34305 RepID=I3S651_LOTJA|nr:unknown [Lotus japonicus]
MLNISHFLLLNILLTLIGELAETYRVRRKFKGCTLMPNIRYVFRQKDSSLSP